MVATVRQDTKPVVMLSSQHDPNITTTVRRKKGNGSIIHVRCPQVVVDCNAYMGGVDLGDQYRKYYQVRMKSRKFYRYIFWFLFEICILNSYLLYQYSPCIRKNLTYLDFRIGLAQQIIHFPTSLQRQLKADVAIVRMVVLYGTVGSVISVFATQVTRTQTAI